MYYVFIGSNLDGSFKMNIMSLRVFVREKPKTELVIWGVIMIFLFLFLIYSLILVFNQETPLFNKNHMANECSVISSSIFIIIGFINLPRIRKSLSLRNVEIANSKKKIENWLIITDFIKNSLMHVFNSTRLLKFNDIYRCV